jgi:hypothetical protein
MKQYFNNLSEEIMESGFHFKNRVNLSSPDNNEKMHI